ncbi:MAG TPA: hypothetical protein VE398_10115 [Acidobacteriota bacterium]|nr:hypothetical protein [Acidobacteriota bacterium]
MKRLIRAAIDLISRSKASDSFDILESKIDGEFHGWSGKTPFALVNGQIWQQSSNGLTHHYAHSPKVLIYRSGSGIKMSVEGMQDSIFVKRIK